MEGSLQAKLCGPGRLPFANAGRRAALVALEARLQLSRPAKTSITFHPFTPSSLFCWRTTRDPYHLPIAKQHVQK